MEAHIPQWPDVRLVSGILTARNGVLTVEGERGGGSMDKTAAERSIIDVRRAHERFHTRISWLDSHHSFSFGSHFDQSNTHHGLLLVSNDDIVRAGTGFRTHPHQDMEIVTWVLELAVEHPGDDLHVLVRMGDRHLGARRRARAQGFRG